MCKILDSAKKHVMEAVKNNSGRLTRDEFDSVFEIVQRPRTDKQRLCFPPMWFNCTNSDKSHAFHLYAVQSLVREGVLTESNGVYSNASPNVQQPNR